MRTFDLSPLFRSSVGFDQLDKLFDAAFREATREVSYPPYNITKHGAHDYRITMAVAGFEQDELEIVAQDNVLTIRGKARDEAPEEVSYLHRGIAKRAFEHKFQLADHVRVTGADLRNGLLAIELVREIPEAMKPRRIEIGADGSRPKLVETADQNAA